VYYSIRFTAHGHEMEEFAIEGAKHAISRVAQPDRLFEDCVENWTKVTRRAIDDLKNFGYRVLLSLNLIALG